MKAVLRGAEFARQRCWDGAPGRGTLRSRREKGLVALEAGGRGWSGGWSQLAAGPEGPSDVPRDSRTLHLQH